MFQRAGDDTPGHRFYQAYHLLLFGFGLLGVFLGAGYAGAHLRYFGDRPINALLFFLIVPVQVAVLLLVAMHRAIAKALRSFEGFGAVRELFWWALSGVGRLLATLGLASAEKRAGVRAALGSIRAKTAIYGSLWLWPVLILAQTLVVCFNAAVIGALLLMVAVSNRAFGWESTLQIGPNAVHALVKVIALPWSWLPNAHPTLQQVEGSRISLYGPGVYSSDALASWWPFLCYAVFVYGLLPRAAVLIYAQIRKRRALAALQFDHSDCNAIIRRMQPVVEIGPRGPEPPQPSSLPGTPAPPAEIATKCLAILARDANSSEDDLADALRRLGLAAWRSTSADVYLAETNRDLFTDVKTLDWQGAQPCLVLAMDAAWTPDEAIMVFLKELRRAAGPKSSIIVLLLPSSQSKKDYSTVWKSKMAALADPYLRLESGTR